jgi:hypothetical protein
MFRWKSIIFTFLPKPGVKGLEQAGFLRSELRGEDREGRQSGILQRKPLVNNAVIDIKEAIPKILKKRRTQMMISCWGSDCEAYDAYLASGIPVLDSGLMILDSEFLNCYKLQEFSFTRL